MCCARRVPAVWALTLIAALAALAPAHAQSGKPNPGEAATADQVRLLQQQRVTAAYRELEQAQLESRRAEQDVLNTEDAYNTARGRAEALKSDLDKFSKARDAAKAKEAAVRKRYDEALSAVPR